MKLLKYCTDWKTIYIIWILSFILISKPLPYYDEYLLKLYEISWWIIGALITGMAIYHIVSILFSALTHIIHKPTFAP